MGLMGWLDRGRDDDRGMVCGCRRGSRGQHLEERNAYYTLLYSFHHQQCKYTYTVCTNVHITGNIAGKHIEY